MNCPKCNSEHIMSDGHQGVCNHCGYAWISEKNSEPKHNYAEAFRLMCYVCEDCGYSEVVWNSRDGAMPFGMICRQCGSMNMMHHNWYEDIYAPHHIPHKGQGVWIDMPESLKPPLARMRAAVFEGTDEERMSLIQALIDAMQPGTPWLIRWGS